MPSSRQRSLALVSAFALILLATAILAPVASAGPPKPYTVEVTPLCVNSGTTPTFTVTITNLSRNQSLGSANITVPSAFTSVAAVTALPSGSGVVGNVIELRNLSIAPGGTFVFDVQATVPASTAPGSYAWSAIAKQANDFNGPPGNDFVLDAAGSSLMTIVDSCALQFAVEPTSAKVGQNITGVPYTPSSSMKVAVRATDGTTTLPIDGLVVDLAIDAARNPGATSLDGTTQNTTTAGVTTFSPISIGVIGIGYGLEATADGFLPALSQDFDIVTENCDPVVTCTASTTTSETSNGATGNVVHTVTTTGGPNGGAILLTTSGGDLDCDDYVEHTQTTITFDVTTGQFKRVTVRIAKQLVNADPNNGAAFYKVCYSTPTDRGDGLAFVDRFGNPVYPEGSGMSPTSGLLPDCNQAPAPCQQSANKDRSGDMVVVFDAPVGDPKGRV